MCGIFGAVGPLPEGALERVSAALAHRGPDLEGRWRSPEVTLLHRRLKIIDLSPAASQPMQGETADVQVVFNGEIYNHHALRRQLESLGHTFRSRSDTEVIVHGYEAWGESVVERHDGMFAFGLWDAARRRLLLARDRAGKKPLFYGTSAGVFRFGSTIESLLLAGHESGVAEEQLPHYLAFGYIPAPATLHSGVMQLEPGSLLVFDGCAHTPRCFWEPRFVVREPSARFDEATAKVRELVEAAVVRRLEADVPLGAFLSGGIDSTIVVGLMARHLPKVRTFSIGFAGDARYDETAFAETAARAFGTDHTSFTMTPSSFEVVEELVRHHDGPFGDSSALPAYTVAKLTRQHVTVALTGDGGDELFCGYTRFLAAEAAERIPPLFAAALARLPLRAAARERSLRGKLYRFVRHAAQPMAQRLTGWMPFFSRPEEILHPELRLDVAAPQRYQQQILDRSRNAELLGSILEHNFRTYLPFDLLVKADRTSMAHGLETRSPFLDTSLIEYVSGLPAWHLRRGTRTKVILRHAFRDLLPSEIARRGKMGFGVPLGAWFRADLRDYLHDHLGPGARIERYLQRSAIDRLLREHASEQADHGQRMWALLTLEMWLRSR
jgi:asparagine synthase (glutamine-hydrolysing)